MGLARAIEPVDLLCSRHAVQCCAVCIHHVNHISLWARVHTWSKYLSFVGSGCDDQAAFMSISLGLYESLIAFHQPARQCSATALKPVMECFTSRICRLTDLVRGPDERPPTLSSLSS